MTVTSTKTHLSPDELVGVLSRHILVDGYHVVMDLERSRGSYLYDARSGRLMLDFFANFATCPIGYSHPKMEDPEFRERLLAAALVKPANSDIYTAPYAEFVETFSRLAIPSSHDRHLFFVEGGVVSTSRTVACPEGITRAAVLELCQEHGIPHQVRDLSPSEIYRADEAFCTGTMGEIAGVSWIDGRAIGAGKPRPMTDRLQTLFRELTAREGTVVVGA